MTAPLIDNPAFRALFTLPPVRVSASTALVVPEMPPQEIVTGDREVDAVLWLQAVVKTGNPDLIAKALQARRFIKTPMKVLGDRYAEYVMRQSNGDTMGAAFASMGFGELERKAAAATERATRRHEALARFGSVDALFEKTPAEQACERALRGAKKFKWGSKDAFNGFNSTDAAQRFAKYIELTPHTLSDCLHALAYAHEIYDLRAASEPNSGEHWPAFQEHSDFTFACMASIAPRSKDEALRVLDYLDEDRMARTESPAILRNLIAGGFDACAGAPMAQGAVHRTHAHRAPAGTAAQLELIASEASP